MATNGTKTQTKTTPKSASKTTTAKRSGSAQVREGLTKARNGATTYVRQGTERVVDVPVGAALSAADRVNELVDPWTSTETRERELKGLRTRVERELNRFERRGGTARRKATQRARQTRNRVERGVKQRRRTTEDGIKKAQTSVSERVSTLV